MVSYPFPSLKRRLGKIRLPAGEIILKSSRGFESAWNRNGEIDARLKCVGLINATFFLRFIKWCIIMFISWNVSLYSLEVNVHNELSQPAFTCSMLGIETLEKGKKYIQS